MDKLPARERDLPPLIFLPPPLSQPLARVKASETFPPRLPHHCPLPPNIVRTYFHLPYGFRDQPYLPRTATSHAENGRSVVATPIAIRLWVHTPARYFLSSSTLTPSSAEAGTPFLWPAPRSYWPRRGNSTTVMLSSVETDWAIAVAGPIIPRWTFQPRCSALLVRSICLRGSLPCSPRLPAARTQWVALRSGWVDYRAVRQASEIGAALLRAAQPRPRFDDPLDSLAAFCVEYRISAPVLLAPSSSSSHQSRLFGARLLANPLPRYLA